MYLAAFRKTVQWVRMSCAWVEDCPEEGDEVAVKMMAYAPEDYVFREGA